MKKHTLITLIVLIITGLLLVACQPAAPSEPEAPTEEPVQPEPAEEPEATEAPVPTPTPSGSTDVMFDPATGGNADAAGLVYENLLKVQNGELFPMLALEGTVSDDGLDYIVGLRPGATFHDGSVLNADTVIANFDRWFDPDNAIEAWATNFGGFKGETDDNGKPKSMYDGIEKVDELTVLVHLNTPDAEFLNKLADPAFAIVSSSALAAPYFGSESGSDGGSGPYTIGAWSDSGLTLEPYSGYWNQNAVPDSSMDITLDN